VKLVRLSLFIALLVRADSLDAILQRMDDSARKFKSVSAKVHKSEYNAVIQDSSSEDGELHLRRGKSGLAGIVQFNAPDERTVHFSGHTVEIYYPKAKQVQVYDAGKDSAKLEQFVLIAFGVSASELQSSYDIKLAGAETIDATPVSRLELRPKSPEVKKMATLIELWIPEGKSTAIKEKVTEPSKNYVQSVYSDIKQNPPLPDSAFDLKIPSGVKRITAH
jgi:outer membrane lipoprotein-sorting protein